MGAVDERLAPAAGGGGGGIPWGGLVTCCCAHALLPCVERKAGGALPRRAALPRFCPAETARAYSNKAKRLGIVAETVLQDINTNFSSSAGELQRLIPIQRCVPAPAEPPPWFT